MSSLVLLALFLLPGDEAPYGKGMTDANKERLVLDDMEDISDWTNGSPVETKLSRGDRAQGGKHCLVFGNVVDFTKGEKNYPIGWPRVSRSFVKEKRTDWSAYDFFECWIYVDTSRASLPAAPLGVGFSHPGHRRRSSIQLADLKKDQWVHVIVPTGKLEDPGHVDGIQFNISESAYKHGDRVDFLISGMALARFVQPAVNQLELQRRVVYTHQPWIVAGYSLVGRKMDGVKAELAIGQGDMAAAKTADRAVRQGEIELRLARPLAPGEYWAQLGLRDSAGKLIDRKRAEFRVVEGPF
jgi:hypothetical protein